MVSNTRRARNAPIECDGCGRYLLLNEGYTTFLPWGDRVRNCDECYPLFVVWLEDLAARHGVTHVPIVLDRQSS